MKVIRIGNCIVCPIRRDGPSGDWCSGLNRRLDRIDGSKAKPFPDWCPLQDDDDHIADRWTELEQFRAESERWKARAIKAEGGE